MTPITLAFDGISGSGKGTQADLLMKVLQERDPNRKIVHFGMGQLLREYLKEPTQLAQRTGDIVNNGGLVPAVVSNFLIARYFNSIDFKGDEHVLIDGAVRRIEQAKAINELMQFHNRTDMHVIVFDLSVHEAFERLKVRGRNDDNEEAIGKRATWFQENTIPAINTLQELGWSVHHIDANRSVEEIHADVLAALGI